MFQNVHNASKEGKAHYYEANALVRLHKHVCLVGHRGARSDAVTRYLGALLGLHYVLLDDAVAHELGQSPLSFIAREGLNVYRHIEASTLRKLVKTKPHGLIACSSDALTGWWTRTTVKQLSQTLWLETEPRRLIDNARKDRRLYPGLPAYILPDNFSRHCESSWQGEKADVRIAVNTSTPSLIAREVIKRMGWDDLEAPL